MAIRRRRKMTQLARAFGQPCQHRVTVRYGLVSRQLQPTGQVLRRLNGLFFHAPILPCRFQLSPWPLCSDLRVSFLFEPLPYLLLLPVPSASFLQGTTCTTPRNLRASEYVLLIEEILHVRA